MKTRIKSTTKDCMAQAELDASFDNGKVAITIVLTGKLPKGVDTPKDAAQYLRDLLSNIPDDVPVGIDIYAGGGEDTIVMADEGDDE